MINGIRVFDTVLDGRNIKDTVSRNAADFWKPFCKSAGWKFSHERVHSLSDLEYFFSKKIKEDIIIFSGHGNENGFYLSNGECFSGEELTKFPNKNHGKIVIFSSCLIGKNKELTEKLKLYFNSQILISYRHLMYDRFCFLNESILLTSMDHFFKKGKSSFTETDFENFQFETEFMKNMNEKYVKLHPMVMT
ncbi:conserved protein of unknown function [Shewanella benthica]|uniref:CHAT domain-containing protein n=1 Tax=Shewanella benthica TaxID=43661 RepID=A0A330M579_9GAMM|nr:hypothetical protein [Shewanella benthica]SQH76200.1 conserved protein of unknown function [Shewanella benthica]